MGFVSAVLALEIAMMAGIIFCVPYTEIDWKAYMEEVGGFLKGQLDYTKLKGGTGPLVYPGGFVWIYTALFYITKGGVDIALAQWVFAGMYLCFLALALSFYFRAGVRKPGRVFLSMLLSKRIRSLFVLRLFNDCWAMLLAYVAISLFAERRHRFRWLAGCIVFSLAVSVKMNVLLFAPGLLYVMLRSLALPKVIFYLGVCAFWQLVAGYPFLLHNYRTYVSRAFEVGRVFTKRWSVNFQFLPDEVFVDVMLGKALLGATLVCWVLLWRLRWRHRTFYVAKSGRHDRRDRDEISKKRHKKSAREEECWSEEKKDEVVYRAVVLTLLESNLVGVALARSLHYQFYTWFFYSVPFVLYYTKLPGIVALLTFAMVRQGFEAYPPTERSSMLVVGGFAVMLFAMVFLGCEEGRDAPRAERKQTAPQAEAAVKAASGKGEKEVAMGAELIEKKAQ